MPGTAHGIGNTEMSRCSLGSSRAITDIQFPSQKSWLVSPPEKCGKTSGFQAGALLSCAPRHHGAESPPSWSLSQGLAAVRVALPGSQPRWTARINNGHSANPKAPRPLEAAFFSLSGGHKSQPRPSIGHGSWRFIWTLSCFLPHLMRR